MMDMCITGIKSRAGYFRMQRPLVNYIIFIYLLVIIILGPSLRLLSCVLIIVFSRPLLFFLFSSPRDILEFRTFLRDIQLN